MICLLYTSDVIYGWDDNDNLNGDDGNDILFGGNGDDIIVGGAGNDWFVGGTGDDMADFTEATVGIAVDIDSFLKQNTGVGLDTFTSIEDVYGSQHDDYIYGSIYDNWLLGYGGDDVMNGRDGNDSINGQDGNDILRGATGNDTLSGEAGNDVMYGGDGADWLEGGTGKDWLIGDAGADTYHFARFSFDPGWGNDTIFGFQDNVDKIEIWVPFLGFNELHITQGGGTTAIVSLYVNGQGDPIGDTITVYGVNANQLTASDFLF